MDKKNKLWYGSDEVGDFHPLVERGLYEALEKSKLDKEYEILHHFGKHTSGIPDFVIVDKKTKDYVLIIEVKKTPLDVFGFDAGDQSRNYVKELYPLKWKKDHHPYFCVTNLEYVQFYSHRTKTPLIGCTLKGSPHFCGELSKEDYYSNFVKCFTEKFNLVKNIGSPQFSKQLEAISETFEKSIYKLSDILESNIERFSNYSEGEEKFKQAILYELLRFVFYHYIKSIYKKNNPPYYVHFPDFKLSSNSPKEIVEVIENNFLEAQKVDFKDILSNSLLNERIIPEILLKDENLVEILTNFIKILSENIEEGIEQEGGIDYFLSIIKEKVYNRTEMHKKGKIMSDEILSKILSDLSIFPNSKKILDPACGDGNLLISAYEKIKEANKKLSHNQILTLIHGFEIDPNLSQLTSFRLIAKNLNKVDNETKTGIKNIDLFEVDQEEEYDSILMNPPYLRNEEVDLSTKQKYIKNLEKSGKKSFIRKVGQPNLYFYFIEKALKMLNKKGSASIILMAKFLNNKDGIHLKEYLLPYLEKIICYPPNFFSEFAVTTCIIVLSKKRNTKISFLKILNGGVFGNKDFITDCLKKENEFESKDYILRTIEKSNLNPGDNWNKYFLPEVDIFKKLYSKGFFNLDNYYGKFKRGGAENSGGSKMIFPETSSNPLKEEFNLLSPVTILGLQNNKSPRGKRRSFILDEESLSFDKGIDFNSNLQNNIKYLEDVKKQVGLSKWPKIKSNLKNSLVAPILIIPRADRKKHAVYYNPFKNKKVLISTNFFFLDVCKNLRKDLGEEIQHKFFLAFLLSSFGQLQFELLGNNHEGMRKMEKFMLQKLKVPDISKIKKPKIEEIVKILEKLKEDFNGLEENKLRNELNSLFSEVLYKIDKKDFNSPEEMNLLVKNILQTVLEERIIK